MDWPARLGIMCLLTGAEETSRQTLAAALRPDSIGFR